MKTRTIVIIVLCIVLVVPALIGIFMVSLGVFMYNSASKQVISDDTISVVESAATQAFNNQFLRYEGENSGSMIKFLIDKIIESNEKNENKVQIKYKGATYETKEEMQSLRLLMITTYKYGVEVDKYDNQGYISVISIKG